MPNLLPHNPIKGISRCDDDERYIHGWQARVGWQGTTRYKRFSDKIYGSPEESLEAAILWLHETEDEVGKPRTERWIRSGGATDKIRWERDQKNRVRVLPVSDS